MIGYVSVGTNDLAKAGAFYDALLGEMGAKRVMDLGRMVIWGTGAGKPMFALCTPYDGQAACVGNGVMVALAASSREEVDRLYAKAIELGATDEGVPGARMPTFYGGYFRDLDGNKLNFFYMG